MSKIVQHSLVILFVLLVVAVGFSLYLFLQKQELEKKNDYLQGKVTDYEKQVRDFTRQVSDQEQQAKDLRRDIERQKSDKDILQKKYDDLEREERRTSDDLASLERDKKDWEQRMATLRRERDDLMEKLKNRPIEERVVEKIVEKTVPATATGTPTASTTTIVVENKANEAYWAGILREKSALELEIANAKKKVTESDLKLSEIKKVNSDLEVELGRLKIEREDILRKIKYGEELADNLSVELARARNEQKAIQDRADVVGADNNSLRNEIKQLSSTKVALEKSIAKMSDDKSSVEKKLVETESIIQDRIDELWKVKKDVDARFNMNKGGSSGSVELAPIVVNANVEPVKTGPATFRKGGFVVSINDENNFVIINLGERDGVRVGDAYKIYRDNRPIGTVAVIQVRKDISAADIKQKTMPFKAGDPVR
ncbi:MAG: hypothetical protein HQL21_01110 [Candidatus Omnitrophica bacterium]|nr:hypothetical protein [Candidatus Omnitrophota bacterium]